MPDDIQFPEAGLLYFQIDSVYPTGRDLTVTITLPPGYPEVTTYYKFDSASAEYYPFVYGPDSGGLGHEFTHDSSTGQEIIVLHLRDGGLGDDDHAANNMVIDPGAPAAYTDPARNYIANLYESVVGRSPSGAEMAKWVKKLDQGESRIKVAQSVWNSVEHRQMQVEQWETQYLGHSATAAEQARWIKLLRRGQGEIAVEASILSSADYRLAHPNMASYVAGLSHDLLGQAGDPVDPKSGRPPRSDTAATRARLAEETLTSHAAAVILAQQDSTTFLGRPHTAQEERADVVQLHLSNDAPTRIAERILSSQAFYDFVNSVLAEQGKHSRTERRVPSVHRLRGDSVPSWRAMS